MRILHTSDWHLGRTLHEVDLATSHAAFFDHLVDVARDERVDAVLVPGDIYDRAFPPVEAVQMLEDLLFRLTELTRVILTPGNHDSATRLGFGSALFRDRLAIRARPTEANQPIIVPDSDGSDGMLVYALPYLDPDMTRYALGGVSPDGVQQPCDRSHEAVMTAAVGCCACDLAGRRASASRPLPVVTMAHAFVTGGQPSDSERDIRVGGVDSVPHGVFGHGVFGHGAACADYVALGHLHGPQRVGPEDGSGPMLRYSGSPLAFSFSEMNHRKSSVLVDFGPDGSVSSHELIYAPVKRRLSKVVGTFDEIQGRRFAAQHDDWVHVTVRGDRRPADMVTAVKRVFPNALEVHFELAGERVLVAGPGTSPDDPMTVLKEFVLQVSNNKPDDAETAVLRHAYEAVLAGERSR